MEKKDYILVSAMIKYALVSMAVVQTACSAMITLAVLLSTRGDGIILYSFGERIWSVNSSIIVFITFYSLLLLCVMISLRWGCALIKIKKEMNLE